MRLVLWSVVAIGCGGPSASMPEAAPRPEAEPQVPAPALAERMETFTTNGYLLAGAEYWPYSGSAEIRYPEEVLWGFYPEKGVTAPGETDPNLASARPEAIACARKAFAALRTFVTSDPPKLRQIIELGAAQGYVPRFYLWTNDYGRADQPYPPGLREARLWYWKRKAPEAGRPPGYWKWESSLTQRGECQVPRADQIERYLSETLETVKAAAR